MPNICALYGCNSNSSRSGDLIFHQFPKNEEVRKKWIHLCKRKEKFSADSSRICSLHFESTAYARNLRYELLGIPVPRQLVRLNNDAIPTLHLPASEVADAVSHVNAETKRKSRKHRASQPQSSQEVSKDGCKKTKAKKLGNATKKPAKWGLNVFLEWLEANGLPKQFESLPKEELDQLLARLYADAQNSHSNKFTKTASNKFTKTAFIQLRDAIQKHLESSPWNIDYVIKTDPAFSHSNTILEDLEPQDCPLKSCEVKHLVETGTLGMHNPTALQNLVWISIALHLGKLTIEQWTKMTKSSFVRSTERGMDYISWSGCRTKFSSEREHFTIYALPREPLCPVKAFDMYVSLLNPETDELWQKPNTSYKKTNQWYRKQAVGKRTIVDMMKNMCLQAKLSKHHSNGCLHVTSSTILMEADIQESDIVQASGIKRSIRTRHRKLPKEKEGVNWQEESQAHCYEDLITVNDTLSPDIAIKCEDIKIEDEDPLATEDLLGDDDEIIPPKRRRLKYDGDVDDNVLEENIAQFADGVSDDPSHQQMTINPCEDEEDETASVAGEESLEMHQRTENFATPQYSQPFIEAQKKDIYDVFAGQIAKTLRDLNDLNTFRRVQIEINNILLDALSGKYKNLEFPEKQSPRVSSNTTEMPVITSSSLSNAQTKVLPVNAGNSTPLVCIINPSHVTQNQVTSECVLQNSVNTVQTVQSTMNMGQIFVNTVTPGPVILSPNLLNSGSVILNPNPLNSGSVFLNPNPVNSGPVIKTPNPVTSGLIIQNPNPVTSKSVNQDPNPVTSEAVHQDPNPVSSESISQDPNPVTSESVNQDPNPVSSESVVQNPNPVTSELVIQNPNPATSESVAQNPNPVTSESVIQNPNPASSESVAQKAGPVIQKLNPVTSGSVLQNLNLVTSEPVNQNQNAIMQKPFNLGQLVNNPMNLWQMIKNPQTPEQVFLRPINLRQMSQIVSNMKQTFPQSATAFTSYSAPKQVTSTLTLTPISKSGNDT